MQLTVSISISLNHSPPMTIIKSVSGMMPPRMNLNGMQREGKREDENNGNDIQQVMSRRSEDWESREPFVQQQQHSMHWLLVASLPSLEYGMEDQH